MYTPLKVTTDFTLLKSLIKIKDLIEYCLQNNILSCGICDTNLFGSIDFYNYAKKNNIKPIIGLEVSIDDTIIYLYAKNYDGYKNLLKLNFILNERNLNIEDLQKFKNNILCIIPFKNIKIYDKLSFFIDLYIGYENKTELKQCLIKTTNVVYVNDIKAFKQEDERYLTLLDIISETKATKKYENNYFNTFGLDNFDFQKMQEVTDLLNLEIPMNGRYIPKYRENDSYEFLCDLCKKGLYKRLNGIVKQEYVDRLKYELAVIKKMDFVDYFLIVYDYVLYAKKNKILVGPGRGSAAGSLVSYVIGITDIDPIKYNLLFERFLNEERVSMPDIDIDFDSTKRDLVINYVKEKYGFYNVSGGLTYSTLKTRLVIREIAKLLKVDETLINKFVKVLNKDCSLRYNLRLDKVQEYLKNYQEIKKVYEISLKIEGLKKNISTHAAGIVIGDRPLYELIPMYKNGDVYLSGIAMENLEDLGLLKMDFLGLKNLNTISNIVNKIENFNISKIDLEDKMVYDLFSKAETDGIFQFETTTFKNMLVKYQPRNFNELVASIALVRPGPSEELETYIKRKNGLEKITYYDESLKEILEDTYGVIVYQEQVISILVKMASFSYAEADNIRRAMSKKNMDIINDYQNEFIKRSINNGYDKSLVENIFNHIVKFAGYGFNKAHSVSYALISYQMAYLKVHYKVLFMFELLNNSLGSDESVKKYLSELRKINLKINYVSINNSEEEFILKNNVVYLPFKMIKNLRGDIIQKILEERKKSLFKDIFDFFKRTINFMTKNDYILLINSSVFNEFNVNTKTLITNIDILINYGNLSNDIGDLALIPELEVVNDYEIDTKRLNEINCYGFYVSNHPSSKYTKNEVMKLEDTRKYAFKNIVCYVMIDSIRLIKTKKNENMAFLFVSDETDKMEITVFPNCYNMLQNVRKNDMIKVWGSVSKRYDKYNIVASKIIKE